MRELLYLCSTSLRVESYVTQVRRSYRNIFKLNVLFFLCAGSGKSYTMMGAPDADERGIIPRLCDALFYRIAKQQNPPALTYKVKIINKNYLHSTNYVMIRVIRTDHETNLPHNTSHNYLLFRTKYILPVILRRLFLPRRLIFAEITFPTTIGNIPLS